MYWFTLTYPVNLGLLYTPHPPPPQKVPLASMQCSKKLAKTKKNVIRKWTPAWHASAPTWQLRVRVIMLCPLLVLPPFENELLYWRRRPPLHGRPGLGLSYSAHLFRCPLLKINPCIAGGGPFWSAGVQGCHALPCPGGEEEQNLPEQVLHNWR